MDKIDFVVLWVDGSDPVWREEKNKYDIHSNTDARDIRYRDWDLMKYWFRSVAENAPWVNKIFFVTWGHIPSFLNTEHPKLRIVKHSDYIPKEFLPTFSSHPIENNLFRIEDLSEHFVLFNDDMFINKTINPNVFFKKGKPRYEAVEGNIFANGNGENIFSHILINDISLINKYFKKYSVYKKNLVKWFTPLYGFDLLRNICLFPWSYFQHIKNPHLPIPILKSTMEKVWKLEPKIMEKTSEHKFRDASDVNNYVFKYWDICEGNFIPIGNQGSAYHVNSLKTAKKVCDDILGKKSKLICINDNIESDLFLNVKEIIVNSFLIRYPNKCDFETK